MTLSIRLLTCIFLSLMLYGEQGYVTLVLCDHDAPQHQQDRAGVLDAHADADPCGSPPICHCHDGMACLCHLLAITAHQPSLIVPLLSKEALPASSVLFANLHPMKVFRPPIC